jgi:hypothetical protein
MAAQALISFLAFLALAPGQQPKPLAADQLIAALRSGDWATKASAGRSIATRRDLHANPLVKAAVLSELAKSTEALTKRYSAIARGESPQQAQQGEVEYADVHLALVQAATKFDGPDVLPALLPEVGTGASVQRRLAGFGASAVDGLLRMYAEPTRPDQSVVTRFGALKTLSAIALSAQLTAKDRARLEECAERSLGASEAPEVAGAIYLAASLRNPTLVDAVRSLESSGLQRFSAAEANWLRSVVKKAFAAAGIR